MPLKLDKIKLPAGKDRRVKITDVERQEIKERYIPFKISLRMLAREYKISPRMVYWILYPDKLQIAKEQYKERRKDGRYYHCVKHTRAVHSLREYKRELFNIPRVNC